MFLAQLSPKRHRHCMALLMPHPFHLTPHNSQCLKWSKIMNTQNRRKGTPLGSLGHITFLQPQLLEVRRETFWLVHPHPCQQRVVMLRPSLREGEPAWSGLGRHRHARIWLPACNRSFLGGTSSIFNPSPVLKQSKKDHSWPSSDSFITGRATILMCKRSWGLYYHLG